MDKEKHRLVEVTNSSLNKAIMSLPPEIRQIITTHKKKLRDLNTKSWNDLYSVFHLSKNEVSPFSYLLDSMVENLVTMIHLLSANKSGVDEGLVQGVCDTIRLKAKIRTEGE